MMYVDIKLAMGNTAPDQELTKQQIIEILNKADLCPLQRYAIASTLAKAAAEAASSLSTGGIDFALENCQPEAGDGKQFIHDGQTFQVQFTNDYNYNQGDELGRLWAESVKRLEKLESDKKAETIYKKGLQAKILAEHPRLQPSHTSVVLKYIAD